jgi:sulfur carrier protein
MSTQNHITLNGEPHPLLEERTISAMIATLNLGEQKYAVEVNQVIIPRGQHQKYRLQPGDQVEIVRAIGGG